LQEGKEEKVMETLEVLEVGTGERMNRDLVKSSDKPDKASYQVVKHHLRKEVQVEEAGS
jgi:hypothetical protein